MTLVNPRLPGLFTPSTRINRDDGVTTLGVTMPQGASSAPLASAALLASAGLSASEQNRARNVTAPTTSNPQLKIVAEGPGWVIVSGLQDISVYVLRDDGVTWHGVSIPIPIYLPRLAVARFNAIPGITSGELARVAAAGLA